MRMQVVDGVKYSSHGIRIEAGARCPHGVVDGDKPLAVTGPRCLTCREDWFPIEERNSPNYPRGTVLQRCRTCKAVLHGVSFPYQEWRTNPVNGMEFLHHGHRLSIWSHDDASSCARSQYAVRGNESFYPMFQEGAWEDCVERESERYEQCLARSSAVQ